MLEAAFLGILQGLTEFIPVSSSAHLILLPWFFGWKGTVTTLSFSVALHFGTLIALLVYFRKDWIDLLKTAAHKNGLFWHILIASVPAAAAGFVFHNRIAHLKNPLLITFTLSSVAVLMLFTEKIKKRDSRRGIDDISRKDAFIIGIAQACALIPGVSRSGITIVAGLMRGFQRHASARFSFLLSTPVVAGASALELRNLIVSNGSGFQPGVFIVGIIVSAVTGYFAIKYLLRFLQNHPLNLFAYYRFLLAFVIILTVWIK